MIGGRLCGAVIATSLLLIGVFTQAAAGAARPMTNPSGIRTPSLPGTAVNSALGIPCTTQSDGTRACIGNGKTDRVPSFDDVPLDVNVWLPPAAQHPPFPAIFYLHGFGGDKNSSGAETSLARQGYVVVAYSARGFGMSCGLPISRTVPACTGGYEHLADIRYEPRDTQYLAGLLADTGLVDGQRIGVSGTSYGAGQSLMLATLKDRIVTANYSLVPWRSPDGKPMRIAAAAPNWAWSDLAEMLVPNGRSLDYSTSNDYGPTIGLPKTSYVALLTGAGGGAGYFAPPGTNFDADALSWVAHFSLGDPYGAYDQAVINEITAHHSPYYLQDSLPPSQREQPAPIFDNTSWTDDLLPPTQQLVYRNKVLAQWPHAEYDLLFSNGAGHPRANIQGTTMGLTALQDAFWNRLLKGGTGKPLGIETYTQGCGGSTVTGPFITQTWGEQHPGEVRFVSSGPPQTITQVSDPSTQAADDPIANAGSGGCITVPATDSPLAATYRLPPATGDGYTMMGSPTVIAKIAAAATSAQVDARLWDVAPNGTQSFITRVAYRPQLNNAEDQVFQLHPNGWHIAAGHVVKLELVGEDSPYVRYSNQAFSVTISHLELRLPVREQPDRQVLSPLPFLDRDGEPLPASELAVTAEIPGQLTQPTRFSCAQPSGRLAGRSLGPITLGMTRARARRQFVGVSTRGRRYMDFFCLNRSGIRVGYPSPKLLRTLPLGERRHEHGRVVLALSSNPHYALRGVRPGTRLAAVARRLQTGRTFHIGLNYWYLLPNGASRGVLKVRHGIIEEIGIADKRLTSGRRAAMRFLNSFS